MKEMVELVSTDKNLRKMKMEYHDIVTECKQIMQHLENKVQHKMLSEAVGDDQAALYDFFDKPKQMISANEVVMNEMQRKGIGIAGEHLELNKLNSMTMQTLEQDFLDELIEMKTQPEVLTVRDLQKVKSSLKWIYRYVMRLTNPTENRD